MYTQYQFYSGGKFFFFNFAKIEKFLQKYKNLKYHYRAVPDVYASKIAINETTIHIEAQKAQKYVFMIHKMTSDDV